MGSTLSKMGVSQNKWYLSGGPYNKDHSILGSISGSPYFGKLPNVASEDLNTAYYLYSSG